MIILILQKVKWNSKSNSKSLAITQIANKQTIWNLYFFEVHALTTTLCKRTPI